MVKLCALSPASHRVLLLLPLLLFVGCAGQSASPRALDSLQGTWHSLSTESDGKQQSGEDNDDLHIITGNHCVVKFKGRTVGTSTIALAPGARITFQMTGGQYTGKTWEGIFQTEGDTLKWNGGWKDEITAVPSTFATMQGDHYFLRTVRRTTP